LLLLSVVKLTFQTKISFQRETCGRPTGGCFCQREPNREISGDFNRIKAPKDYSFIMSLAENDILADIEGLGGSVGEDCPLVSLTFGSLRTTSGQILTPTQAASAPSINFKGQAGKKYTVICTDPDAISRSNPIFREFIHWVQADLSFAEDGFQIETARNVMDYVGPGPPYNSGLHRYVFILYEQGSGADVDSLAETFAGRGGKRSHLAALAAGLGPVVGVGWIQAQWDESVDVLHEAIGFLPPPEYRSPRQQQQAL
jgi:hypothetical protein